jgi:hypothetical protein
MRHLSFRKIKAFKQASTFSETTDDTIYQVVITNKSSDWTEVLDCNRKEFERLKNEIDALLATDTLAEKLTTTEEKANKIQHHYNTDEICSDCKFRLTRECLTCLFTLDSPLERKLFVALKEAGIYFTPQHPLNWDGRSASMDSDSKTGFINLLTKVDFYIERKSTRLCIYTDGHTYHERTEEQAMRDKNIDRKLQELGFKVLRYPGKAINEEMPKVISEIRSWIDKASYDRS